MSEPVQLAKAAREQLAAALNALQTADVPDELVDAAEPVAQAMGVLHRIERTNGQNLDGRDEALDAVRSALGRVQKVDSDHPAVERVMEAIAGSLSKVHALVRYAPPAPPPPVFAPQPAHAPQAQPITTTLPLNDEPVRTQPLPPAYARPTPAVIAPQLAQPQQQPHAQPQLHAQPAPRANPVMATMPSAQPAPRAIPADRPSQSGGAADRLPAGAARVDVELGIHSPSNFYKGLGGNDVIEHGGIFVATYKMLKINTPVTLRVLLPGDYEFTASAVVQWTREGGSSEPGYGARFTQITTEGRQLVYRYTRNREPMFYDDL